MSSTLFEHGYALIIGVGGDLPVTVKDAEAIREAFIDPQRAAYPKGHVLTLTEERATKKNILEALDALNRMLEARADSEATVVIYYSGHGVRIENANADEYFLIPHGYRANNRKDTAISGEELTAKLQCIKAQKLVVFLDCCYAAGMHKDLDSKLHPDQNSLPPGFINKLSSGIGQVTIASSRDDELSRTGNPLSIFTIYLLEAINGKASTRGDGYVRILDIVEHVDRHVPLRTNNTQRPVIGKASNLSNFPICCYGVEIPKVLEVPSGPLPIDSQFYQERGDIEKKSCHAIEKPGALLLVRAARQMGRTSLLNRLQDHVRRQGCRSVSVNFRIGDSEVYSSTSKFLQWFCFTVTDELDIDDEIEDIWQSKLTDKQNCSNYFQDHILRKVREPILLGLDDINEAFKNPKIAEDFLSMLRVWHEKASAGNEKWQRLHIVISYITDRHLDLDVNQSPFNVGELVELPEFTQQDLKELAQKHQLGLATNDINQLIETLGGNPHLIRMALYEAADKSLTVQEFIKIAKSPSSPYLRILTSKVGNLSNKKGLLDSLEQVFGSNQAVELHPDHALTLLIAGLAKSDKVKTNLLVPLCDLYRELYRTYLES